MNFFLPKLSFKNCFLVSSISYNKYQIGSSVDNYNIKAYKCELNIFYHAMKKKPLHLQCLTLCGSLNACTK